MDSQDSITGEDAQEPLFFYMPNAPYGELCQWYRCNFIVNKSQISFITECPLDELTGTSDNDITFNCAEQFMMYCKAARFRDGDTQQQVLESDSPKEQKRLGRLIADFTDESWDQIKDKVVVAGNMAKFGQSAKLQRKLLATGDCLLVEAASSDRVWGIGYSAKHAMFHRQHWGENRLGKALMQARKQLREREETSKRERAERAYTRRSRVLFE